MGNSVRDEVKDAIRSTLEALLEGHALGIVPVVLAPGRVDEAVASIADNVFDVLGVLPEEQDMQLIDYILNEKEEQGDATNTGDLLL